MGKPKELTPEEIAAQKSKESQKRYYENAKANKQAYQKRYRKELADGTRVIKHKDGTVSTKRTTPAKQKLYIGNQNQKRKAQKLAEKKRKIYKRDWSNKKKAKANKIINDEFFKEFGKK